MASFCLTLCFGTYVVISLLLHIGEVVLNTMFVVQLYEDSTKRTWFTIMLGLMLLPMVTVQLVSALLLLHKRGEHLTTCQAFSTAVLHIFQLGFVWRHIRLITEDEIKWKKRDLADLCILRLFYTFSASLPIFGMQLYLILTNSSQDWLILSATSVTLLASGWALASYRRQTEADITEGTILTFPGTIFRLVWRFGEIISRMITLIVFASLYKSWVFLVVLLHWVTMMVCIFTSVFGFFELVGVNRAHRFFLSTLIAYIYIFCYVNFNSQKTQWRYITFYTIMFLENSVLLIVWYLSTKEDSLKVHTIIFITCITFVIGILSMLLYYRFFHIPAKKLSLEGRDHICLHDSCINCKLSLCNKHSKFFQRPFSAGWVSQYQKALYQGDYYKNLMQDSLIDSMSEWEVTSSSSDSASEGRADQKENIKSVTFHSVGTYSHKRFLPKADSDSDSTSIASQQHIQSSSDSETSDSINPLSHENTSQTKLLTDSWEKLIDNKHDYFINENVQKLQSFRPISAQNLEDWYSDGYSTDHSTDFQLPITVLAKLSKCRVSIASDSTQCTMCKHLKLNRKRPKVPIRSQEKIIEENIDHESKGIVLETSRSAAWYNCSESGDSAFPQETISTTCTSIVESDEDGISETSFEMII